MEVDPQLDDTLVWLLLYASIINHDKHSEENGEIKNLTYTVIKSKESDINVVNNKPSEMSRNFFLNEDQSNSSDTQTRSTNGIVCK